MIIKDRSKAALNLESLKLINGFPSHIWDPLVMSGRITFEIDETDFVREDNTKQLMEKYKTEVLIIKQADGQSRHTIFSFTKLISQQLILTSNCCQFTL
jgi:hypothetical protein